MAELKVTQVRSTIGVKPKARGTMRALGLRGIGQTNVLPAIGPLNRFRRASSVPFWIARGTSLALP